MLRYKFDVLEKLKDYGYTTYILRKDKLLNETAITKLRNGNTSIDHVTLNRLCTLLRCQPGDILEYVYDETDNTNY